MDHTAKSIMSQRDVMDHIRGRLQRAQKDSRYRKRPFITLSYAQSIDGCISAHQGEPCAISNSHSRRLTHELRAIHDAILVGINTVLIDDPRLNVRLAKGSNPQPVVVDSQLRLPRSSRLFSEECVRPLVAAASGASQDRATLLTEAGAKVVLISQQQNGYIDLMQLFEKLKEMGLHSVMVEGGAKIITSIVTSRLADQLVLTISPQYLAGVRSVSQVNGEGTIQWPQALTNVHCDSRSGDLILRGDFKIGPP